MGEGVQLCMREEEKEKKSTVGPANLTPLGSQIKNR